MKENLDKESRLTLIKYRIQRAKETLIEADYNAKGGFFNTAVNRLYYSAFYAANAVLISKGIACNSHAGLKSMFSMHLIKTGILNVELGKTLNQLFINRQSGDYEDFIYCDEGLYKTLRPKTEEFINTIEDFLKIQGEI